ncbi:cation diffusion facilitator family transporter [Methylovirgula sp. 4M-Z18]|uniref:cation diffusion facilitator family transporter n=1 Tax=Methylovirgula sp. 4M-Z18 TaxID=2293567 RepID=UPI000E2ED168|nr:cation diffusion facilitator family transporter [Methylovirgula sp. 4M-Z18]RFB78437.1 cation transporter [Methylovirgula sp. 4M-Z18]
MANTAETKEKAALLSIGASAALSVAKLVAGLLSGSLALLSEAMHGALDTGATILTYFAVRVANKPADDTHPYGHGKVEAVAALAETGLLAVLAIGVVVEAFRRLWEHTGTVTPNWLTYGVLIISIGVDFVRWRGLHRIAHETGSVALAADALHFSSDLIGSCLVLIGLIATRFGFTQGDAVAAIGVALFIAVAGYRLGRSTIDTLVDAAPKGLAARVRAAVQAVPGVASIENVRLRPAGGQIFGEILINVPRTLTLERTQAIKAEIGRQILAELPNSDVTITANPQALDNETFLERVLLIAAHRRLPVHHVTVQDVDGRKCISLDLEIDGRMSQGNAHRIASELESMIRLELGANIEVETHIEPLETRELHGVDVDPAVTQEIATALAQNAKHGGVICEVHNVRARDTGAGLVVNYHCRVAPERSVNDVHAAVDALERATRGGFPHITRLVGHAEPLRPLS